MAYGLRPDTIRESISELLNDHSILISGARGIGKSSLSVQLQKILNGDYTLLKRCALSINVPRYITAAYVCFPDDTLEDIVDGIITDLQNKFALSESEYRVKSAKFDFSIFGIVKTSIEVAKDSRNPTKKLATAFARVIEKINECYINPHINISIDELDQFNSNTNFAHFVKVVLEVLIRKGIDGLSFIFAGQDGIYNDMLKQQPAFERLVKHVKLSILDIENSEFVLTSCLKRCQIPVSISQNNTLLILGLSSGYPYSIHLLGHEMFCCMLERYNDIPTKFNVMSEDIIYGIENIFRNKKDRFDEVIANLTIEEKKLIFDFASQEQKKTPFVYVNSSVTSNGNMPEEILQSLLNKKIIFQVYTKNHEIAYQFCEELFRVYISYTLGETHYKLQVGNLHDIEYEDVSLNINSNFIL